MGKRGFKLAVSVGLSALLMLVSLSPADASDASVDHHSMEAAAAKSAPNYSSLDNPNKVDWSVVESGNCLIKKSAWGFRACAKGDPNGYWKVGLLSLIHI